MQPNQAIMLLAIIPGLLSIVLFVATLSLKPQRARLTVMPPQPLHAGPTAKG